MRNIFIILFFVVLFVFFQSAFAQTKVLSKAHAHNDYEHQRPLFEALEAGFTSIEADIHLVDGELYVSHGKPNINTAKTLKSLYLEPLKKKILENQGKVYSNYDSLVYLMIDVKTEAEATYQVLKTQLAEYTDVLTHWKDGKVQKGGLLIFLSGNRSVETVMKENLRLVAIDGRPDDLDKGYSTDLMPVISDNYHKVLGWNGKGQMSNHELTKLKALTTKANLQGKKLRFWASPENENVWKVLLENGIGLIGTDKLADLSIFLKKQ
jgi:hypothetical protein